MKTQNTHKTLLPTTSNCNLFKRSYQQNKSMSTGNLVPKKEIQAFQE